MDTTTNTETNRDTNTDRDRHRGRTQAVRCVVAVYGPKGNEEFLLGYGVCFCLFVLVSGCFVVHESYAVLGFCLEDNPEDTFAVQLRADGVCCVCVCV